MAESLMSFPQRFSHSAHSATAFVVVGYEVDLQIGRVPMAQAPLPRTRSTTEFTGFPKDAFKFFRDLSRNNNRDWFQANKERYEKACKEPMKLLVSALGVDPKDAYLSRINRDLRFARDKSPYHTYIGAGVRDSYIHLSGEG